MEQRNVEQQIDDPPVDVSSIVSSPELISLCKCLLSDDDSPEEPVIPKRKRKIFSTVSRTEAYLRERRIPELIRYLLAKIMTSNTHNASVYAEELLDNCMIYRSGFGKAPVLFEDRHIEAVIKSFDPGQRGWLTPGQVRRIYVTLGLTPPSDLKDKEPTDELFLNLREKQESELFSLLNAGSNLEEEFDDE